MPNDDTQPTSKRFRRTTSTRLLLQVTINASTMASLDSICKAFALSRGEALDIFLPLAASRLKLDR